MFELIRSQLAPTGMLRAAINLGNTLLVNGRDTDGEPTGVSPSLARAIADRLGVPVQYVVYPRPTVLADAVNTDAWDVAMIGAEPQRAEKITFTAAYAEIEATYLVAAGSALKRIEDVDQVGIRISMTAGSAFGLWLDGNIRHATLVASDSLDGALRRFHADGLEVLAGIRSRLLDDQAVTPGSRILDGRFTAVQQAVGTARDNEAGAEFLYRFVEEAKSSGLVAHLIQRHDVRGLSVAPPS